MSDGFDFGTDIADRLLDSASAAAVARFAARVARDLAERSQGGRREGLNDRWLTLREAAEYLGCSVAALHKLTCARAVPFHQRAPGAKCWFKASELDEWRRQGEPGRA